MSLKNKCDPGLDETSSQLIKPNHLFILLPFKHIVNSIFSTGTLPKHLRNL